MTPPPLCITEFLTDGSLIRLCESAGRLIGLPVTLRDAHGRVVVRGDGDGVFALAPACEAVTPHSEAPYSAALIVGGRAIGSITVDTASDHADPAARSGATRFVTNLAATVAEVCQGQADLRRRVAELGVLYRLSSMLVGATTVDAVLNTAVESAVRTLHADAGAVRILDEERRVLQLRASVGLSDSYLAAAGALPADRICDERALTGEVVVTPDLSQRDDILHADALHLEGLTGMASVGLVFRGETLGLLRLYTVEAMDLDSEGREVLQSIAQQIAAGVANARLLEAEADARRVRRQLQLASDVQRRMLPHSIPETPRLDLAARFDPSFELGGDFYDIFCYEGQTALALGDVVGKGVAAALLTSSVRATIRAHTHNISEVDEVLALTNQALCRDTLLNEFATVFLGMIDPESLRLGYCNAGHDPPIVARVPTHRAPTTADLDELPVGGMVLGVDPSQRYQRGVYELQPGDAVLIYSDGLPDAMNFQGEKFGKHRVRSALIDILTLDPGADADRIADHILWERRRFTGLAKQTDDTTIIVARVAAP